MHQRLNRKETGYPVAASQPSRKAGHGGPVKQLSDLPPGWWTDTANDYGGYQMVTRTWLAGKEIGTLLDYGAAVSTVPEELVVGCIIMRRIGKG